MRRSISLNGVWNYQPIAHVVLKVDGIHEDSADLPPGGEMNLPVNWQLHGLDNFHGKVRFTRSFSFEGLQPGEDSLWLNFQGVDYFAEVWVNEIPIGRHEGYFQPFSFDISSAIKTGENRIRVDVTDVLEEPGTLWPDHKRVIKGVISHWDCRPGSWDLQTGQDMNSGGIWNDVSLETRPAAYLGHIRTSTKLVPQKAPEGFSHTPEYEGSGEVQAIVLVEAEVFGPAGEYRLSAKVGSGGRQSGESEQTIRVTQSGQRHTVVVQVPEPQLWWTWDLGEPHLEPLTLTLSRAGQAVDRQDLEIGLRELRLDPQTGEWWLNKQRFFVRGTNVVPTLWLSEYDQEMISTDIRLLREAYINGVRVCVHVNRQEFYDALDRAGIIAWQDFALQWGYVENLEVTQDAVQQIRDMVRMLVNHPCIALWCCQNESTFHNKFILDPVLAEAVAMEDGSRYIRVISEFSEHTYGGWYSGHYRDYSSLPGIPILTEFGAQALPDVESVKQMAGETWPPDWQKMAYHDFQYDQTFHVAGVPLGSSWEEFVENSQNYQSRLLKFSIEKYRQNKYKKLGGMFQFMFMDCWPSITWSVVAYDRTPKKGYHTLKQCYQPVLIGMNLEREAILVGKEKGGFPQSIVIHPWVVNDRHTPLENCTYSVSIQNDASGIEEHQRQPFSVPTDGVVEHAPSLQIAGQLLPGEYELRLTLHADGQEVSANSYNIQIVAMP